MNLELSEEQTMLQDVVGRLLASHAGLGQLSACEPLGFDEAMWQEVWELGIPLLRAPDSGDASLLHAIVVAEEAGRHLASVPLMETIVVRRLLAQLARRRRVRAAMLIGSSTADSGFLHDDRQAFLAQYIEYPHRLLDYFRPDAVTGQDGNIHDLTPLK